MLTKGHNAPRIEVLSPDKLPAAVPATPDPAARRPDGTLATSAAAKAVGARGGAAKAARARLVAGLGIRKLAADHPFAPFQKAGEDFLHRHLQELANLAGGHVGVAASSMAASAAMQLAASRFAFDVGASTSDVQLLKQASSLADASRQNLLAAYELAIREAEARESSGDGGLADARAAFQRQLAGAP
jgi:hypothetical protein